MAAAELAQIVELVNTGGMLAALLVILWAGWKRLWVFGWAYKAKDEEVIYWRDIALRSLNAAEAAVGADEARAQILADTERVIQRRDGE